MKTSERKMLASQQGFTLIEIIAVLVILGILAAVAVPKFIDLTTDAQEKAFEGALAAGFSNATLAYSKYILKNSAEPTGLDSGIPAWTGGESVTIEDQLGDYSASYQLSGSDVVVDIYADGSSTPGISGTFNLP